MLELEKKMILSRMKVVVDTGLHYRGGKFIPGGDIPPLPNLTKRQNFDNIVNDHGNNYLIFVKPVI